MAGVVLLDVGTYIAMMCWRSEVPSAVGTPWLGAQTFCSSPFRAGTSRPKYDDAETLLYGFVVACEQTLEVARKPTAASGVDAELQLECHR